MVGTSTADEPAPKARPKVVLKRLKITAVPKVVKPNAEDAANATTNPDKSVAVPTHKQGTTLQVNADGRPQVKVACFCLTPDDKILAGCTGEKGEVRVLDAEGKLVDSWSLPVNPDAIFCRADGTVFVAGEGKVVKLSADGKVTLTKDAPQAVAIQAHPEKLREEIIAQAKQRVELLGKQAEVYDGMIKQADKQIETLREQVSALENPAGDEKPAAPQDGKRRAAINKQALEQRIAMFEKQKENYAKAKEQFAKIMEQQGESVGKLTDEQIDAQVKASMVYKIKASSISALDSDVFRLHAPQAVMPLKCGAWTTNLKIRQRSFPV